MKKDFYTIKESWYELIEILKDIKKDYETYCEIMNEMATQYMCKEKLIDIIIMDEIIDRCKEELTNIRSINNQDSVYENKSLNIINVKMKSINSYLLYSDYIHDSIDIINDMMLIDNNTLKSVYDKNIDCLIRFIIHIHQIINITAYFVNSSKIIEEVDNEIKFVEVTIETKKEDIDNIIDKYKAGDLAIEIGENENGK